MILTITEISKENQASHFVKIVNKARFNLTYVRHTVRRLNQMSRQCRSKVELIQLGSAHEKYGV